MTMEFMPRVKVLAAEFRQELKAARAASRGADEENG